MTTSKNEKEVLTLEFISMVNELYTKGMMINLLFQKTKIRWHLWFHGSFLITGKIDDSEGSFKNK